MRAAIVLGVPIGLLVGGLLADAVGPAATFEAASGAVVLALIGARLMVPDLRAKVRARPPLGATLRAMKDPRLLAVGALNFALSFAAGGMVLTTLALLVHDRTLSIFHRSEQGTAGLLMGWMTIADAATTPLMGRLGDRFKAHARVATFGIAILVPGLLLVGLSAGKLGVLAGLGLIGVGAAGLGPSLLVVMGALVPQDRRGTATGLLQLCGDVGGMLGPLVGTALFATHTEAPYVGTAVLMACFVPVGLWLAVVERRAREPAATI